MKILQINKFFYPKGGSETYFFALSELLKKAGHEVIEFSMQDEKNRNSKYSRYFIKNINFDKREGWFKDLKKALHLLYSCEAKKKLGKLIREEKPDIAHLHNFNFQLTPSILGVLKKHKIPVVWTLHDYKAICPNYQLFTQGEVCERCKVHKYYNCWKYRCLKNSGSLSFLAMLEMYGHKIILKSYNQVKIFIAPSKFLAQKIKDWHLPEQKIKQLYYSFDLTRFKPQNKLGEGICYIGRLSPEKGIFTLLEACKSLPEIKLTIIGTGPIEAEIRQYLKDHNLENIKMIGYKSGQELMDLISQSKIVIAPSLWYENNPLAILEAFALGKPVIGSDLGGIPELVKDNKTGLVFVPGDDYDLADKIKSLYNNDAELKVIGENCRRWVETNCDPQKHLAEIIKIYKQLLK
ncbi:MAG: glycosyltransferase family 4 protein [Candidatus Parcubacteria bacterium]|nr:glycosyltransferase family 4 protein [Candidatus Parcubacteria bacterium]